MKKSLEVTFLSIAQFKKAIGAASLEIVHNKNTDKLSVLSDDGTFFRCQQSIDADARMAFLIPDGVLDNACLVNTSGDGVSPLTTKASL
jgi:hypothetical protein